MFIFFKNKSVFLKIPHFVQCWRKRVMNSIENEALVETSKCLYHIYRSKTSLSTLLCHLNSSVTNILLLNTFFFYVGSKWPPPWTYHLRKKPLDVLWLINKITRYLRQWLCTMVSNWLENPNFTNNYQYKLHEIT